MGVSVARPVVGSTGGFLCLCFLLVGREVLPVFLGFSRLRTRFSSAHFWSLLRWRRLGVVLPASAVDCCCLSSLRAGVCSLLWQWRISARVLMAACLPLFRGGGGGGDGAVSCTLDACCIDRFSGQSWPILDFTLGEFPEGLCRFSLA